MDRVSRQPDSAHSDQLVGVVHHGNQHVEQNHQRDDVVRPKHRGANELGELVTGLHVGDVQVQQAKDRPEQRLQRLKQPEERPGQVSISL